MKIVWIIPEFPYPVNSGGRKYMWNKIINLAKNNEIYLFSIKENDDELYINEVKKYCKDIKLYDRNNNILTLFKSLFKPFPVVSRYNKNMKKDIKKCCNDINPNYIIVDFPQMLCNLDIKLSYKYKVILCQHNIEHLALRNIGNGMSSTLKKQFYNIVSRQLEFYEKKIYSKYKIKLYTFVSIDDKKIFEDKYKVTNTLLVPIGSDIIESHNNVENNILYVAKMSYEPNNQAMIWFLKNVWDEISKRNENCKFYIVGKDPSNELIKLSTKYKNVIITGTVDSVDEYYDKAKIFIVPLFTGGGVKVKLLEAMGRKKLVITTSKGVEGTNFIANKELIVTNTSDEFINKCDDALNNYDKYVSICENGFNKVKDEYSWEKIITDFEKKLVQMLED